MTQLNLSLDACYTVTELTREIKELLEGSFSGVQLRGEVSNLRRQPSGHLYFSLKDAGASISCVCFRADASRLKVQLRDGMQINGFGRINVYEPRGNYQMIFRMIEEDGIGRLQQAFLELKEKLSREGLFDPERKRPLPGLPRTIGFVTSPSGAALRDFISILRRRGWGGRLIVIPALVQGPGAAPEIVQGIEIANRDALCDLLVVGRGSGSLEDLWPFNEEIVARAIAASSIPIISAVGHEIDFSLSDFAADFRAETPSAAAEWITSARQAYLEKAASLGNQLNREARRIHLHWTHRLALASTQLRHQHPRNRLEQAALRLDDLQARLAQNLTVAMRDCRRSFQHARERFFLLKPEKQVAQYYENLRQLRLRLNNNSHQATLRRGYALVRSNKGVVLSNAGDIHPNRPFIVEMRDATFSARREIDPPSTTEKC